MQKAGYDPRAMITFLERMQAKEKTDLNSVLVLFQTHPPTAERIRLVQEKIASAPPSNPATDTKTELQKIKALLASREAGNAFP
jgi:predicted Zn-dependent protease